MRLTVKAIPDVVDRLLVDHDTPFLRRHPKATFLCIALLAVLVASTATQSRTALTYSGVFAPNSFWYQDVSKETVLNPKSDIYTAEFIRQYQAANNLVAINTTTYSMPVYRVSASEPNIDLQYWNCQNKSWEDPRFADVLKGVPIPANAIPAGGTDASMSIYQASTDTVWEFWKIRNVNGVFQACWGGRINNASQNPGTFANNLGVSAAGTSYLGGLMTIQELQSGRIDHALEFKMTDIRKGSFSYPANRTDGLSLNTNTLKAGQRMRLDPSIDVDALNITPFAKMVAHALQTYGMILTDTSGTVGFPAEDPTPMIRAGQPNPYPALFGGKPSYSVLNGMPWGSLQALPDNYGQPASAPLEATTVAPTTTTSSTTAAPATTVAPTTTVVSDSTTIPPPTSTVPVNAWTLSSSASTSGGVSTVKASYSASAPPSGYVYVRTQIYNSANSVIAKSETKTILVPNGIVQNSVTIPAGTAAGTYNVRQIVFNSNWTSTYVNRKTLTFVR